MFERREFEYFERPRGHGSSVGNVGFERNPRFY